MKNLLLILLSFSAYGQTCAYTTGKIPQGTVTVFRNGAITRQGPDFTYSKRVITPVTWSPADNFSTIFSIQIPLTLPDGTPYIAYRNWQENWDCPGTPPQPAPALASLEQCSGSGVSQQGQFILWDQTVAYPAYAYVNFGAYSYMSTQAANLGQQPDLSPGWWKALSWDCAGMLRAIITLANGSSLVITGVPDINPGSGTWLPIK
jgi:hypothetical protein